MSTPPSAAGSFVSATDAESLFLLFNGDIFGSFMLAALIVYDSTLTFDKEVEFFWHNLRSSTSWIFLLNRYLGIASAIVNIFGFLFNVNNLACHMSIWIPAISNGLTIILFDYILLQRVVALYCRSKIVSRILFTMLSMEFVIGMALNLYTGFVSNVSVELLSNNAAFCTEFSPKVAFTALSISWALPVITGLIFMILSLYKSIQYRKETCGVDGYSLIDLLIRDQATYFLVVVISSLAEITTSAFSSVVVRAILASIGTSTISCVVGSRLIINLKVDGKARADGGTETGTELSTVEFAFSQSDDSEYTSEDIA